MLFYIRYGCSIGHESLIVDSETYERADEWAEASAQEIYYSYDCNYINSEDYDIFSEEEISEMEYQDMLNDIDWVIEFFDKNNEEHMDAWNEQEARPFEI